MSKQPEALRLADALRDGVPYDEAEIENQLRRLSAENERLAALVCDYAAEEAPDALRTVAADRDRWHTKAQRSEAQRDALLEKIKAVIAAEQSEGSGRGGFVNTPPTREHQRRVAQAWQELHAAIKAVGGEKE